MWRQREQSPMKPEDMSQVFHDDDDTSLVSSETGTMKEVNKLELGNQIANTSVPTTTPPAPIKLSKNLSRQPSWRKFALRQRSLQTPQPISNRKVEHVSYMNEIKDDDVLQAIQEIRRIRQRNMERNTVLNPLTEILEEKEEETKAEDFVQEPILDVKSIPSTSCIDQRSIVDTVTNPSVPISTLDKWKTTSILESRSHQDTESHCDSAASFADVFENYLSLNVLRCETLCSPSSGMDITRKEVAENSEETVNKIALACECIPAVADEQEITLSESSEVLDSNESILNEEKNDSGDALSVSRAVSDTSNESKELDDLVARHECKHPKIVINTHLRELSKMNRTLVGTSIESKEGEEHEEDGGTSKEIETQLVNPSELMPMLSLMEKVYAFLITGKHDASQLHSISALLRSVDKRLAHWENEHVFQSNSHTVVSTTPNALRSYTSSIIDHILEVTERYIGVVFEDDVGDLESTMFHDMTSEASLSSYLSLNESTSLSQGSTMSSIMTPPISSFISLEDEIFVHNGDRSKIATDALIDNVSALEDSSCSVASSALGSLLSDTDKSTTLLSANDEKTECSDMDETNSTGAVALFDRIRSRVDFSKRIAKTARPLKRLWSSKSPTSSESAHREGEPCKQENAGCNESTADTVSVTRSIFRRGNSLGKIHREHHGDKREYVHCAEPSPDAASTTHSTCQDGTSPGKAHNTNKQELVCIESSLDTGSVARSSFQSADSPKAEKEDFKPKWIASVKAPAANPVIQNAKCLPLAKKDLKTEWMKSLKDISRKHAGS